jgi:signal peptidase II
MNGSRRWRLGSLGIAALVLMLDQSSKAWAQASLLMGTSRGWLPGLIDLQLVYNRGAAFSLFTGATQVLALISAGVAFGLVVWILRLRHGRILQLVAAGLLLGGTLGNGLDRWRLGAVVDFLALVPIRFPVFNVADVAINLAVVVFALDLLRQHGSSDA